MRGFDDFDDRELIPVPRPSRLARAMKEAGREMERTILDALAETDEDGGQFLLPPGPNFCSLAPKKPKRGFVGLKNFKRKTPTLVPVVPKEKEKEVEEGLRPLPAPLRAQQHPHETIAPTTKHVYEDAIDYVLDGVHETTPEGVVATLQSIMESHGASRYRLCRAAALRAARGGLPGLEAWGPVERQNFIAAVAALPSPTRENITPITRVRRRKKDLEKMKRALNLVSDSERAFIVAILCTGARRAEMKSLRLEERKNGIAVKILSVKGGPPRDFFMPDSSPEGVELMKVREVLGETPFVTWSANRIAELSKKWSAACTKAKLNHISYQFHALRHQFASNMKSVFGDDDRVSRMLGHVNTSSRGLYGRAGSALARDTGWGLMG